MTFEVYNILFVLCVICCFYPIHQGNVYFPGLWSQKREKKKKISSKRDIWP